jgi:hypothetical protein
VFAAETVSEDAGRHLDEQDGAGLDGLHEQYLADGDGDGGYASVDVRLRCCY